MKLVSRIEKKQVMGSAKCRQFCLTRGTAVGIPKARGYGVVSSLSALRRSSWLVPRNVHVQAHVAFWGETRYEFLIA